MDNLWQVFSYYLLDFIKLWIVFWGIVGFKVIKKIKWIAIVGCTQVVLLLVASFYMDNYEGAIYKIITVMVVLTVSLLFEGKLFKKLAYALLTYILVLFLDVCLTGVISLLLSTTYYGIRQDGFLTFICNAINVLTIGIIAGLIHFRRKSSHPINLSKKVYALLFSGAATGITIISGFMVTTFHGANERLRRVMLITTIIVCISYSVVCLMVVIVTESRDNFKALSRINQSVIEAQQEYYLMVHEKQQEMRAIRHEMRNHLSCISGLSKAGKLAEMEEYINHLVETPDVTEDLFDTGNDIVNAILNDAQSKYKSQRIFLRLTGGFPSLHIKPLDLCVIFANTISNAVEAVLRMDRSKDEDAFIDINISSYKDDLYIDIKNPVSGMVEIYNGNLITSKKDKTAHGFGTKNVRQRVEKYQGTINYTCENNYFKVEIFMKNKA